MAQQGENQNQDPQDPQDPDQQDPARDETDWKAEARKWEQRSKENAAKLKAAEPRLLEYDALVEASKTDLERQQEEATRWQREADRWRDESVRSRIEALAAVDFTFPGDAVAKLDPSKYLGAGGEIDDAAIKADLAQVLAERPNWRREQPQSGPRPAAPNRAQGSSGNGRGSPTTPAEEFGALIQGVLNKQ